jgi:hypothetical protein
MSRIHLKEGKTPERSGRHYYLNNLYGGRRIVNVMTPTLLDGVIIGSATQRTPYHCEERSGEAVGVIATEVKQSHEIASPLASP